MYNFWTHIQYVPNVQLNKLYVYINTMWCFFQYGGHFHTAYTVQYYVLYILIWSFICWNVFTKCLIYDVLAKYKSYCKQCNLAHLQKVKYKYTTKQIIIIQVLYLCMKCTVQRVYFPQNDSYFFHINQL